MAKTIPSSAFDWAVAYQNYYNRLFNVTVSRFEWTGLPEEIDRRYIELALYERGQLAFSYDDVIGYYALPFALYGGLDIYRNPNGFQIYAPNGKFRATKNADEAVPIYNDYMRHGGELLLQEYAVKLTELERTIQINSLSQRHPFMIVTDEKNQHAMREAFNKIQGGEPVIYTYANLAKEGLQVLDIATAFNCDKLYELKVNYWNEYLTAIGISNVAIEKKERMISDEVRRQSGGTMASRYSPLDCRRMACEKINKLFNLDVWVDYRSESDTDILNDVGNSGKTSENGVKEAEYNE